MRRGGNWDNSDIKGARKLEWTDTDRSVESSILYQCVITSVPQYFIFTIVRRLEFLPEWLQRGWLAP